MNTSRNPLRLAAWIILYHEGLIDDVPESIEVEHPSYTRFLRLHMLMAGDPGVDLLQASAIPLHYFGHDLWTSTDILFQHSRWDCDNQLWDEYLDNSLRPSFHTQTWQWQTGRDTPIDSDPYGMGVLLGALANCPKDRVFRVLERQLSNDTARRWFADLEYSEYIIGCSIAESVPGDTPFERFQNAAELHYAGVIEMECNPPPGDWFPMLPVVMEHFVRLGRELGKTDTELAAVLYLAYADCLSHANRIDGLTASNAPGLPEHVQHTSLPVRGEDEAGMA